MALFIYRCSVPKSTNGSGIVPHLRRAFKLCILFGAVNEIWHAGNLYENWRPLAPPPPPFFLFSILLLCSSKPFDLRHSMRNVGLQKKREREKKWKDATPRLGIDPFMVPFRMAKNFPVRRSSMYLTQSFILMMKRVSTVFSERWIQTSRERSASESIQQSLIPKNTNVEDTPGLERAYKLAAGYA